MTAAMSAQRVWPDLHEQAHAYLVAQSAGATAAPHGGTVDEAREIQRRATAVTCLGDPGRVPRRDLIATYGEVSVRVREYRPRTVPTGSGAMLYFHGGGWVVADLDTYDELCASLAEECGCVVYSVEYRRAPEDPFPAAVLDADAATRWVLEQADDLGIDAQCVVVAGDSAGGNLAAVVSRRLRDDPVRSDASLAGQVLLYPVIDARMDTESFDQYAEGHFLTRKGMEWYWDLYCPGDETRHHPDASPIRAADLSGLPPLAVIVASHDPLRDEGELYADAVRAAGGAVEFIEAVGQLHGFVRWTAVVDESTSTIRRIGRIVAIWFAKARGGADGEDA